MGKGIVKLGEGNWAVKDGNLLAAKETNGRFKNAEFTVARGTRATYVGRDGLIKESNLQDTNLVQNGDYEELGDNLAINGTFDTSIAIGTTGSGWALSSGTAEYFDGGIKVFDEVANDARLRMRTQSHSQATIEAEKTYKIQYEIKDFQGDLSYANFSIYMAGTSHQIPSAKKQVGTHTVYLESGSNTNGILQFQVSNSMNGFVVFDNISVQKVDPNDRWSFSNVGGTHGWRIADGKAICDTNAATKNRNLTSSLSLDNGKTYKLTLDILQSADNITVYVGGTALSTTLPTGENLGYEYYILSADHSGGVLMFYAGSSDLQEIDNVSIQEVKTDTPRIDFTNNTDGHLLLEPTSENKVTYSEDFSKWTNTDITFGSDGISPSGETNANLIQTGTAGSDQVSKVFTLSATNTTTYSVFIKRVSGAEWIDFLIVKSGFSHSLKVWFNINNGTVGSNNETGTTTFDSASIENYGNDWYRLIVTTTDSTNNTSFNIRVRTASADGSDTRVNNSSYYLWGMQLEALSYATSYIPTSGSTVTRDAETCTGAGEAVDFNSSEGVLYAEIAALVDGGDTRTITIYSAANNRITLSLHSTTNRVQFYIAMNGYVNTVDLDATDISQTNMNKIACKFKANDYALWINGVEKDTNTTQSNTVQSGTLNSLNFDINGSNNFYGKVKAIRVYKEALSDSELTTLTS